jgi:hypothetical protein
MFLLCHSLGDWEVIRDTVMCPDEDMLQRIWDETNTLRVKAKSSIHEEKLQRWATFVETLVFQYVVCVKSCKPS